MKNENEMKIKKNKEVDFFRINENSNTDISSSGDIYGWTGDRKRSKMEEITVLD